MRRSLLLVGVLSVCGLLAATPAMAQKSRPTTTGPDADGDGVADAQDRCPNTPRGSRVTRDGCPVVLMRPGVTPATGAPAGPTRPAPAPSPSRGVTPQAAPAAVGSFTAGLAIEPFDGEETARPPYLRRFAQQLDSAIVSLVEIFRGTAGVPLAGADSPTALSGRERDRWTRCRNLHWDLQSYIAAMHVLAVPSEETDEFWTASRPAVARAAEALDSALTAFEATAECDNIASMVAAPGRWTPWGQYYTASARTFYDHWYDQAREVSERNRAFVVAVNGMLPAAQRIPVPPAMPRTPPYAGAGPR